MEIDGKHMGTSSVTRGLARHKMQQSKPKEEPAMEGGEGSGSDQAAEKLSAVHPEARGASKSFHMYQHEGKIHAHAHDHEAGTHEHREHPDMHSAMQHGMEHMGGAQEGSEMAQGDESMGEMGGAHGGGMEQLGMGG